MRRVVLTLLVLAVLAGCTGPAIDVAGTEAPTLKPAPTPTPATATPAEIPDAPADATVENTADYADLLPEVRTAFDAAVQAEAKFLPESPYVDEQSFSPETAAEFHDVEYVRTDGAYYAVDVYTSGEIYAAYDVHATPGSPGENDAVVAHENLSAGVSPGVRWAIENRSYYVPLGKWNSLPDELGGTKYVRYEGETYEMSYAVGDYWVTVLEARRA